MLSFLSEKPQKSLVSAFGAWVFLILVKCEGFLGRDKFLEGKKLKWACRIGAEEMKTQKKLRGRKIFHAAERHRDVCSKKDKSRVKEKSLGTKGLFRKSRIQRAKQKGDGMKT